MLGPILGFASLPERALGIVRDALDGDAGFRSRVVEQADVEALDEGSRLFLTRPDGWADVLCVLVEEASRRAEVDDMAARLADADDARRALSEQRDRFHSERDDLAASLAELRGREAEQQEQLDATQLQLAEALATIDRLTEERGEAVRQLKVQEGLAERRLQRQRELEQALELARDVGDGSPQGDSDQLSVLHIDHVELQRMTDSIAEVEARASELAEAARGLAGHVESLAAGLEQSDDVATDGEPDGGGTGGPLSVGRREVVARRRRPVRLGRGLTVDSVEGLDALLARPGIVVMLDGYNVSMKGWPNLELWQQRESLVGVVGALAALGGATWHIVFDGDDDGARPAVSVPLAVRVHFTPAEMEADDRLLEFVDQAPEEASVVVVSSDRRVRDGARDRGANVVSSETLLSLARRS